MQQELRRNKTPVTSIKEHELLVALVHLHLNISYINVSQILSTKGEKFTPFVVSLAIADIAGPWKTVNRIKLLLF